MEEGDILDKYLALIGDIRGSRQIAERANAQQRIKAALEATNTAFDNLMASRLTLTLGDEFQALLYPHAGVMHLLDDLQRVLEGFPFRLGLGYGGIRTAIDPQLSIGADGECFWHAREALEYVHDNDFGGRSTGRVIGYGGIRDDLLNGLFQTSDALKAGWTDTQRGTFHHMLAQHLFTDSFDQQAFAARLGISPSSLSKRLSAGNVKLYLRTRQLMGRAMEVWHHDSL